MDKDPRLIYSCFKQFEVSFFGFKEDDNSGRKSHTGETMKPIKGKNYIIVPCSIEWNDFVIVSGLFKIGKRTLYHSQRISVARCKIGFKFFKHYPKTTK